MSKKLAILCFALLLTAPTAKLAAQQDSVHYVPRYKDPANEELRERADSLKELQDSITAEIRDRQEEYDRQKRDSAKILRFSFENIDEPESPGDFQQAFHFPPVRQYRTGTCWCFSGTSFLESEVNRLTGRKVKLSEMYTVYNEYIEKARYYIQQRGKRWPGQGSETNAVFRIMSMYGAMPEEVYPGTVGEPRHDHSLPSKEIVSLLKAMNEDDIWDEDLAVATVKQVLDKYFGKPPETFEFEGETYTPKSFLSKVLQLKLGDYVCVQSTLSQPFYTQGPYGAPDNWWLDSSYYNVPLDEWYASVVNAIDKGYTLVIGGDVSEPGWNGFEDACVIPDFDIPQAYINQDSREFRIYNRTTGDDHGIHIVGHTKRDGRDWFLIKDSGSSGHWGTYKGYYFMRDDYVRLKMLTFTMHKDMFKDLLPRFTAAEVQTE